MSVLPTGWAKTRIDAISEFNPKTIADYSLKCAFSPMQYLGTRFRASMGYEERVWGDIKKAYVHFRSNDVIVAKVTPCFENGKAGVVPDIPNGIGAGSSEFCVFRPAKGIDERYLLAWLSTEDFRRRATVAMTGSVGLKRVPKDVFLSEEISLAPEAEQLRIADKLDTILTRVDALNDRLAHITPLIKRFRQSVLAAATSGRLTEDWRGIKLPVAWESAEIQDVAQVGTGSTPLRSNSEFFASFGTPWITSSATSEEIVKLADEYVTDAAIAAHRLKIYPIGTLLVAMYGEGKTRGQVTELGIHAAINQACAAIAVDETKISKKFVKLTLQANYMEMRVLAEGGNQPNLNLSKIKSFGISVPPHEEQTEIVRRVEILLAYADRLEAHLQTVRTAADRLTPALLAKAFRGELVPQDPDDEPATELLRRLGEARAVESPPRKMRTSKVIVN